MVKISVARTVFPFNQFYLSGTGWNLHKKLGLKSKSVFERF